MASLTDSVLRIIFFISSEDLRFKRGFPAWLKLNQPLDFYEPIKLSEAIHQAQLKGVLDPINKKEDRLKFNEGLGY